MSTLLQYLPFDSTSLANVWAFGPAGIDMALLAAGFVQTNDTGQVMWNGMNLTAVSISGTTATYTYNSLTGPPLVAGRTLTVTGFAASGNNGTFVLTGVMPASTTTGTFTVSNPSGVNVGGASGLVTAATLVGAGSYFAPEFWTSTDVFTSVCPMVLRIEYGHGNYGAPFLRITCGNGTTGGGGFSTGNVSPATAFWTGGNSFVVGAGTNLYECYFSYAPGRFAMLLMSGVLESYDSSCFFAVERQLNSSGSYQGNYYTMLAATAINVNASTFTQATIFGPGFGGVWSQSGSTQYVTYWCTLAWNAASQYGNNAPMSPVFPFVGYFDCPMTVVATMRNSDNTVGATFSSPLYAQSRTWLYSNRTTFAWVQGGGAGAIAMRWD